jgi:hypothetical protein
MEKEVVRQTNGVSEEKLTGKNIGCLVDSLGFRSLSPSSRSLQTLRSSDTVKATVPIREDGRKRVVRILCYLSRTKKLAVLYEAT